MALLIALFTILLAGIAGFCVWLNRRERRVLATMSEEERAEYLEGGTRLSGDW